MIRREIEPELIKLAEQFKVVAVIGPRHSGKTTLTRHVFDKKPYVNLENPDSRRFALDDPRGFLFQICPPLLPLRPLFFVPSAFSGNHNLFTLKRN